MATISRPALVRNGWKCTSATLAQWLAICGYPEAAHSFNPEWTSDPAPHFNRFENDPAGEAISQLIHDCMQAKQWIRCSHLSARQVLLLRQIREQDWLLQYIGQDDQHEFIYERQPNLPRRIAQFYQISTGSFEQLRECRMTDEMFEWLCATDQTELPESAKVDDAFQRLIADMQRRQQGGLDQIAHFAISDSDKQHDLKQIVFFLPAEQGVWIAEREAHADLPVVLRLYSQEEWQSLLEVICEINN